MTRKQSSQDLSLRPELACARFSDSLGIAKIKPAPAPFVESLLDLARPEHCPGQIDYYSLSQASWSVLGSLWGPSLANETPESAKQRFFSFFFFAAWCKLGEGSRKSVPFIKGLEIRTEINAKGPPRGASRSLAPTVVYSHLRLATLSSRSENGERIERFHSLSPATRKGISTITLPPSHNWWFLQIDQRSINK